MSNTSAGAERELQKRCLAYFKNRSKAGSNYGLQVAEGVKVLGDVTCVKERGKPYQMICSLSEVDIVFYKDEKVDLCASSFFKFTQVPKTSRDDVKIPLVIIELKRGGITSDAIRARNLVAQKIKQLFPFCAYIFLGDQTKKTPESVLQHGKNFNHYFLYQKEISDEGLSMVYEGFILPHLQNLYRLGLV